MDKELKAHVLKRKIEKWQPYWNDLYLREFDLISPDAAELIASAEGSNNLGGLQTISDKIANVLGSHKRLLKLCGS